MLGAWVDTTNARSILDIGTGSGLIALMLAQRTLSGTFIDAVEPSARDADQARSNVSSSPWQNRMKIHQCTIQDFRTSHSYDLVVSNPPFFSSSLLPPSRLRAHARHTVGLSHSQLLDSVSGLLAANGRFAVVLPAADGDQFRQTAQSFNLQVNRSQAFFTRPGKKQERWLFEFSRTSREIQLNGLTLYSAGKGSEWSAAYRRLTGDFYLDPPDGQ